MSLLVWPFITYCCSVFELFGTLDFYFGYVNATSIFIHDIGGIGSENRRQLTSALAPCLQIWLVQMIDYCNSIFSEISIQNEQKIIEEHRDSDCELNHSENSSENIVVNDGNLDAGMGESNDGEEFDQFVDNVIEVGQGDANNRGRPRLQTSRLRGRARHQSLAMVRLLNLILTANIRPCKDSQGRAISRTGMSVCVQPVETMTIEFSPLEVLGIFHTRPSKADLQA
ncbi:hypothetical protein J6590_032841 [Homalodisca vitripennis]|nr:hypothetical protein J6590_032841 [Homalodisca vitripennis]